MTGTRVQPRILIVTQIKPESAELQRVTVKIRGQKKINAAHFFLETFWADVCGSWGSYKSFVKSCQPRSTIGQGKKNIQYISALHAHFPMFYPFKDCASTEKSPLVLVKIHLAPKFFSIVYLADQKRANKWSSLLGYTVPTL